LVGIDTLRNFETVYTQEQIDAYTNPLKEDFKKNAGAFIRTMFVKGTNPKFADKIIKKMTRESPEIALSAMEEMLKLSFVNNPLNIKVPVRCLNSDLWPTNSEVNRKYSPDFDVRIMPGTGHFLMLEKPAEFNKQLDDIIQEILKK
jgi:pimeloyl-ACP methyl ester carboxylesterase